MQAILKSNARKAELLISKFGETWNVINSARPMHCFNGDLGLQIQSLDKKHKRNVKVTEIMLIK